MSYTDLRDFEQEYARTMPNGIVVQVEKLGGGTVGKAYTGTWRYIVLNPDGSEAARGQDMETGMPHTHKQAARVIAEYFDLCEECQRAIYSGESEADQAGKRHTQDCSRYAGTDWGAAPNTAKWYGEVVVGRDVPGGGTETDYFHGYSNDADPHVGELTPDGWETLESKLERTPNA